MHRPVVQADIVGGLMEYRVIAVQHFYVRVSADRIGWKESCCENEEQCSAGDMWFMYRCSAVYLHAAPQGEAKKRIPITVRDTTALTTPAATDTVVKVMRVI